MRMPIVLIVDDEKHVRVTLELLLADRYETVSVENGLEAIEVVKSMPVDMVLMDLSLPHMDGITALGKIKEIDVDIGIVMLTASNSAETAVKALKLGAYDYITKPFEPEDLLSTINRYTDKLRLFNEVSYLKEELHSRFGSIDIVSISPAMKDVIELVRKVSETSSNVLITGESGTGKEVVARAIQAMGPRAQKPFVVVNCGAIPSELMESELFGHEKGSFTGAYKKKVGKFEYAHGGTIFLDEIATIPTSLQVKLLRVIQDRTFARVGSNRSISSDVRIVTATNADLMAEVKSGRFREDLYYRLKVVPIHIPPLRERTEDIPGLVDHFIKTLSAKCLKTIKGITPEALSALMAYPWPGNIRELENLIERLVVVKNDATTIRSRDLPLDIFCFNKDEDDPEPIAYHDALKVFEKRYIIGVLNRMDWNRSAAARHMNVHRNTLLLKMKTLGISKEHAGQERADETDPGSGDTRLRR